MLSCLVVWRGAIGDDDTVDPQQLGAFFVLLGVHMSDKELHVAIADIDDSGDMLVELEELIEWCARTNATLLLQRYRCPRRFGCSNADLTHTS